VCPHRVVTDVETQLKRIVADEAITVRPTGERGELTQAPPLTAAIMGPIESVARTSWPAVTIVPTMSVSATDGRLLNAATA
jgi:hypothetical protein